MPSDDRGGHGGGEEDVTRRPGVHPHVQTATTAAGKALGDVVVEVRGVTKQYRMKGKDAETVTALKCINLCYGIDRAFPPVRRGEFVMIRGPSGGGKTTLLNMIGTIDCPTDGTVRIMGQDITGKSDDNFLADLRLQHIGFVFQTFNLIPTMTALENVELPMTLLGKLNEKERHSRAKQLLGLVGLRNRVHHLPSELSGGEQQRVTIARSLANNPAVLLLDEPTGDLDTATTIEVMDLLLNINNLAGTTMIMVTHNPDVECYADRILYVSDGEFAQQVINERPVPLVLAEYEAYLKRVEAQNTRHTALAANDVDAAAAHKPVYDDREASPDNAAAARATAIGPAAASSTTGNGFKDPDGSAAPLLALNEGGTNGHAKAQQPSETYVDPGARNNSGGGSNGSAGGPQAASGGRRRNSSGHAPTASDPSHHPGVPSPDTSAEPEKHSLL